ncbi:hypothetical protein [Novosphingobium resinovorum]|nr:hypothetical protein [Novosphingobium resinovorum]
MGAMAACGLLAACGSEPGSSGTAGKGTNALRYKMTVEVDTPHGIKSGYAIRELTRRRPSDSLGIGQDRGSTKLRGDAVVVRLPENREVFALLIGASGDVNYSTQIIYWSELWGKPEGASLELYPAIPRMDSLDSGNALPMLVRFAVQHDPRTVEQLMPEDFERVFGAGVKLKRIAIGITADSVTNFLENKLEDLGTNKDESLDRDFRPTTRPTLAQRLGYNDFTREK